MQSTMYYSRTRSQQEIDNIDQHLLNHEQRIVQMISSQEVLNKRFLELTELRHVLKATSSFFTDSQVQSQRVNN
jgi:V-type H+-transporting ATPase subunit a